MIKEMLIDGEIYDSETGELINKVEQVEVEVIEDELPLIVCNGGTHIQTNTVQLEKGLKLYLEKFDIEVTAETEKDASKKATELNKLAQDLNKKRIGVGKEIKKPADELKKSVDNLIELVQKSRTKLIEGVEIFKTQRFDTIRFLLNEKMIALFLEHGIDEEYQFLDLEPLVVVGSLGKVNLTKKAIEQLTGLVLRQKSIQDNVKIRKFELKETCTKAGLEVEISYNQIEPFIKDDDYNQKLEVIINSQLEVEEKVRINAKEQEELRTIEKEKQIENDRLRFEKEKQDALDNQKRQLEKLEQDKKDKILQEEENERLRLKKIENEKLLEAERLRRIEKETGVRVVRYVATFEMEVPLNVTNEAIKNKYDLKMKEFSKTFYESEIR